MVQVREWKLQALTDIWTGDARGGSDRLIPTGLMGSLRWWYEVLVRGLGGEACDPTVPGVRCPDKDGKHCVACELFGCTGWARKFRLMVLKENGEVVQEQIGAETVFILRFIPLRPIRDEEWCLLDLTLRLIAEYGAIGGRTVLKPSDEQGRAKAFHHKDFGLISVEARPNDLSSCTREQLEELEKYVQSEHWRKGIPYRYRDENGQEYDYSWASLQNFWCVKGRYLARQDANTSSFNFVIGRPEPKGQSSQGDSWLAGRQPDQQRGIEAESKKIFSFRIPQNARRTFGFVQNQDGFQEIMKRLEVLRDGNGNGRKPDPEWKGFDTKKFIKGEQILERLFPQEEGT